MNLIGIDTLGTKCAVLLGQITDDGNIEVIDKHGYATAD